MSPQYLTRRLLFYGAFTVVVFVTVIVALISRVGLLAYFAAMLVYYSLNGLPLTLDASAWFAARSASRRQYSWVSRCGLSPRR